jgi:hypothetical protein
MGLFRSSTYGDVVLETRVLEDCSSKQSQSQAHSMLYTQQDDDCTLKYPVYMVQDNFEHIVATTWKHDEELGRGYLLLSTSGQDGRIWQWETGGGPIPIGRTLNLKGSGCRSNLHQNCSAAFGDELHHHHHYGSGGIVVDALQEPPRLVVAEWGEGRISRLEENGARTPLVIQLTTAPQRQRIQKPFQLLMTPFGDLMILDYSSSSPSSDDDYNYSLWRLPQATHIPGLESLAASREAHAWETVNTTIITTAPQKLLQSTQLGGMALQPNQWLQLYVTMRQENGAIVVVSLSLDDDENDNDDEEESTSSDDEEESTTSSIKVRRHQSTIVLDYSNYTSAPGAIEVDEKGNMYLLVDAGILFVSSSYSIVGKMTFGNESLVDLTLGEDKFLYMSTRTKLFRMRVRNGPLKVPTDLVINP